MRARPLLVVALSPALERYLTVPQLALGAIHRASEVAVLAGGKGVHAAQAARVLGADLALYGVVGGPAGQAMRDQIAASGIRAQWVEGRRPTRTCTCITDALAQTMTEVDEAATSLEHEEVRRLTRAVLEGAGADSTGFAGNGTDGSAVVALSGSLPAGFPPDALAALLGELEAIGATSLIDTSRDALAASLAARPSWVKVNHDEASAILGGGVPGEATPESGLLLALQLQTDGPRNAVVTLGEAGSVAALEDGSRWRLTGPGVERGLAVGSGDCFLGTLGVGLARGLDAVSALSLATACLLYTSPSPRD